MGTVSVRGRSPWPWLHAVRPRWRHRTKAATHDATQRAPCMLVILLGSYRANGPYLVLMRQWLRWWRAYSGDGLRECHVITAHPDADPGGASVVADAAASAVVADATTRS